MFKKVDPYENVVANLEIDLSTFYCGSQTINPLFDVRLRVIYYTSVITEHLIKAINPEYPTYANARGVEIYDMSTPKLQRKFIMCSGRWANDPVNIIIHKTRSCTQLMLTKCILRNTIGG